MKKKGFTLIELLAVITILGITIAIVLVKVNNNINNSKNFAKKEIIKTIENAALIYVDTYYDELNNLKTLSVDTITIEDLLKKELLNEKSVKDFSKNDTIVVCEIDDTIKVKYTEYDVPAIFLNGSDEITTYINRSYNELGAKVAIPNTGIIDLTDSNISSNVDTTKEGKYEVTYSYGDAEPVKRIVNVSNLKTNYITVTFDANGGTVPLSSKEVLYGTSYGELPTPTRDGYTFMGWSRNDNYIIPDKYQEVEYIESTGTQWIDTGITPTSTTDIEVTFMNAVPITSDSDLTWQRVYGQDPNGGNKRYQLEMNEYNGTSWRFCVAGNVYLHTFDATNAFKTVKFVSGTGFYVDGTLVQATTDTETNNYNIWLFRGYDRYSKIKISNSKLWENNNLIRNFIPCYRRSDGEIGMYDTVEGEFYTNQGTGEFLKGEDIEGVTSSTIVTNLDNHTLYAIWEKNYTVTFNANGGTVPISSKTVIRGKPYGELPVPKREGYTFLGWNGKNMFNLEVNESVPSNTSFDKSTLRTFVPNTYIKGLAGNNYYSSLNIKYLNIDKRKVDFLGGSGYGIAFPFVPINNKNYYFSYNIMSDDRAPIYCWIMFYNATGELINSNNIASGNGFRKSLITIPNMANYLVITFSQNINGIDESEWNNVHAIAYNIQLEEGTEATPYEPYYIKSDTKVVQNKDHTLKAIWEPNS